MTTKTVIEKLSFDMKDRCYGYKNIHMLDEDRTIFENEATTNGEGGALKCRDAINNDFTSPVKTLEIIKRTNTIVSIDYPQHVLYFDDYDNYNASTCYDIGKLDIAVFYHLYGNLWQHFIQDEMIYVAAMKEILIADPNIHIVILRSLFDSIKPILKMMGINNPIIYIEPPEGDYGALTNSLTPIQMRTSGTIYYCEMNANVKFVDYPMSLQKNATFPSTVEQDTLIYVSRENADVRIIQNDSELIKMLTEYAKK